MSFRLSVLKASVTKIFIIVAFVFFAALYENRLLLKINKVFTLFFLIKGFFEFDFLCEVIMIII